MEKKKEMYCAVLTCAEQNPCSEHIMFFYETDAQSNAKLTKHINTYCDPTDLSKLLEHPTHHKRSCYGIILNELKKMDISLEIVLEQGKGQIWNEQSFEARALWNLYARQHEHVNLVRMLHHCLYEPPYYDTLRALSVKIQTCYDEPPILLLRLAYGPTTFTMGGIRAMLQSTFTKYGQAFGFKLTRCELLMQHEIVADDLTEFNNVLSKQAAQRLRGY